MPKVPMEAVAAEAVCMNFRLLIFDISDSLLKAPFLDAASDRFLRSDPQAFG
jgi:hypothetical protein